jgi:hypothetical protein
MQGGFLLLGWLVTDAFDVQLKEVDVLAHVLTLNLCGPAPDTMELVTFSHGAKKTRYGYRALTA